MPVLTLSSTDARSGRREDAVPPPLHRHAVPAPAAPSPGHPAPHHLIPPRPDPRAALVAGFLTAAALVAAAVAGMPGTGHGTGAGRSGDAGGSAPYELPVLTDPELATLSPQLLADRLDPLRDTASALDGTAGRGWSTVYAGVRIDANTGHVDLYLTDPAAAPPLLAATRASASSPAAARDDRLVRVHAAAYDRATLDAAAQQLLDLADAGRLPFRVYAVGAPADGSGLTVRVDDVDAAARLAARPWTALGGRSLDQVIGLPLRPRLGGPLVPKSWSQEKWNDTAPFIGGDAITTSGRSTGCTAGLPATRISTGRTVLVSAAHCFRVGQRVYTHAGSPGRYGNGLLGSFVGTVSARYTLLDASVIDAPSRSAVSLTWGESRLVGVGRSYEGDLVCHAGQRSYFLGHPTPCGIKVTDGDLWCGPRDGCPGLGYRVHGAWGDAIGTRSHRGWGAAGGDSGATIFAVTRQGLQARGILSDGDAGDGAPGVFWSQAPDVLWHFGLRLDPRH